MRGNCFRIQKFSVENDTFYKIRPKLWVLAGGAYRQMTLQKKQRFHIQGAENVDIRPSLQIDFDHNISHATRTYIYEKVKTGRHCVKHWHTQHIYVCM